MAGQRPDGDESTPGGRGAEQAESGRAAFAAALRVRRNARWGLAVGVALTVVVFVLFVAIPGARRSPLWYVGLGFVLAMSTGGLVAFLLTLGRAVRLSREL